MKDSNKITLISPFFFPEDISTGKYNTYLVKSLVESDMQVDVVSSHPFYPDWKVKKTDLTMPGVVVYRGGLSVKYPQSQIMKRLVLELWYSLYVAKYLIKKRKTINKVVIVFPPVFSMFFVSFILPGSVHVIGVIHDLQGIMANSESGTFRSVISKLILKIEKIVFKKLDRVVCLSASMRDILLTKYNIDSSLLNICYPFVSAGQCSSDTNYLINEFEGSHKHIVYSGALGEKQRPAKLMMLFDEICRNRKDIICHIVSRGPVFDDLKKQYSQLNLDGIKFHDLVPEYVLDELFRRSTMQIIPQAKGTGAGAFPSKLPNLLSKGVPVFAICDEGSELSTILNEFDNCSACHTWDIEVLIKEISKFLDEIQNLTHEKNIRNNKHKLDELFNVASLVRLIKEG